MSSALPSIGTKRTAVPRHVLKFNHLHPNPPVIGVKLDGAQSRDIANTSNTDQIRAGMILGKIASSGKYAPWAVGVTTANLAGSGTSISASAATVTELVRRLGGTTGTGWLIGPPAVSGAGTEAAAERITISNATGTTITVSAVTLAFISGSIITLDDGTQNPLGIYYGENGYPVKVTDKDSADITVRANMLIFGIYDEGQLITLPADSETKEWLRAKLHSDVGGPQLISYEVFTGSTLLETPTPTPTPTPSPSPTPTPTPT